MYPEAETSTDFQHAHHYDYERVEDKPVKLPDATRRMVTARREDGSQIGQQRRLCKARGRYFTLASIRENGKRAYRTEWFPGTPSIEPAVHPSGRVAPDGGPHPRP